MIRLAPRGASQSGAGPDVVAVLGCWTALAAITGVAAAIAVVWPALGPATGPHRVLRPSIAAIVSILVNNLRVLAAPFILVASHFAHVRAGRLIGDAIVAGVLAANATAVGLALGRWGTALAPFIPQLPVEYLAAATAAAAWLQARRRPCCFRHVETLLFASATLALTAVAAMLEVLLTPHAR